MSGLIIDQMMTECKNGSVEGVKSILAKSKDINVADKEGKTLMHHAVINNRVKVLYYLLSESAEIDIQDLKGNTPLHYACELELKDIIVYLLINKADYTVKNSQGKLPGEENPDISIFVGNITDEEKCFKILSPEQTKKLTTIYNDIDYDKKRAITMKKAVAFNHFIDQRVSSNALLRDAEDFLEEVAIINKESVSLEEWLFSFSKLLFCDKSAFNKFISEYESACNNSGGCFSDYLSNNNENLS